MEFLAKSRIATVLVVVSTSSLLFAQSGGRSRRQDNSSSPDALHIVGLSIVATERSLLARDRGPLPRVQPGDTDSPISFSFGS